MSHTKIYVRASDFFDEIPAFRQVPRCAVVSAE
jgi:hypothetical protein